MSDQLVFTRSSAESLAEDIATRALINLEELSRISGPGPGVNRLAYSPQDAQARAWFREKCREAGLKFEVDPIGNCFGWGPGAKGNKPLLLGSHLDSVINAGRYDGTAGVAFGLEVVRALVRLGAEFPLAIAAFACEESTRFGLGTVGSRYLVGELGEADFDSVVDRDGIPLRNVIADAQLTDLDPVTVVPFDAGFASGYLEVHIDQGTTLIGAQVLVGAVNSITGVTRTLVTWLGETSHSGGRLRPDRRDALLAAANFIVSANGIWQELDPTGERMAFTVGRLVVSPNSPNTVPGHVEMITDLRSAERGLLVSGGDRLRAATEQTADQHHLQVKLTDLGTLEPTAMDPALTLELERAAQELGIAQVTSNSLSGHDAMVLGQRIPATMLLLANPTGISHAPEEGLDESALVAAAHVLLEAIPQMADRLNEGRL